MYKNEVRVFKKQIESYKVLISRCRIARITRNFKEGLDFCNQAISMFSERFEGYQQRAYLNVTGGKLFLVEYDLVKALERCDDTYWKLILRSEIHAFCTKNSKKTLAFLQKAKRIRCSHWYVHFKFGFWYKSHLKIEKCEEMFRRSLKCVNDSKIGEEGNIERACLNFNLGLICQSVDRVRCIRFLDEALALNPSLVAALVSKSKVLFNNGDGSNDNENEIIGIEDRILLTTRNTTIHAESFCRRAELFISLDKFDEAEKCCDIGLELKDDLPDLYFNKMKIFFRRGEEEKLISTIKMASTYINQIKGLIKTYRLAELYGIGEDKIGPYDVVYKLLRENMR